MKFARMRGDLRIGKATTPEKLVSVLPLIMHSIGGLDLTWARVSKLAEFLRNQLIALGFITVHDLGAERCGIVTFTLEGMHSTEVQRELTRCGVNVSVSLPEHTRLDMSERRLEHLVRASVHYYNSEEEIERFCNVLASHRAAGRMAGK
jgi:cysteine desulfurase / selenocysteine lyase